jgi:phage repressor protein C with HTH and peptisase S24 domain
MGHLSTKNSTGGTFSERLLWLIVEKANGKVTVFAKKAGIPHSTFYNYVDGRLPSSEHLVHLRDTYGVNINWLLTGQGDPYSQVADEETEEPAYEYNLPEMGGGTGDEEGNVEELLGMARKVLSSENKQAAEALEKNIRYFVHAIQMERRVEKVEARLKMIEEVLIKKAG